MNFELIIENCFSIDSDSSVECLVFDSTYFLTLTRARVTRNVKDSLKYILPLSVLRMTRSK